MKFTSTFYIFLLFCFSATAQTPITAITLNSVTSAGSYSYIDGANTYNWGVSPNNTTQNLTGFTSASVGYSYASLPGSVKLRRVDNLKTTGNYTVVWAEGFLSGPSINILPAYQNNMELFFNDQVYNKGTDNFFDNTSATSNNIERLDFVLNSSFSTASPSEVGFPVFDRGDVGAHDPFVIAAILSVDGSGNPTSYGNILRVTASDYGDPGLNVSFRILKAPYPSDLVEVGSNTQNRGGVYISLQDLGIAPSQVFYGYSILANDLPMGATPADLVDYNNSTFYKTNTGISGGIDMVAVTGVYITNTLLPTRFSGFSATNNADNVNLKWAVENENAVDRYEIERSADGISFTSIQTIKSASTSVGAKSYSIMDNIGSISSKIVYYRIKQFDQDGSYYYSKIVAVRKNNLNSAVTIYPNPVKGNLFLNIKNSSDTKARIYVTNAVGKKVLLQNENLYDGNNSVSIEGVERLSKGVYFISINMDSGDRVTKKFTKL
ncbi:MAG: T9SS type A sorting domain-containing protein [Ginsengibacter sp.]